MRAGYLIVLPLIAFAITLGIVIGERLSQETMIVIVGVVAGIAASIPTSLLTAWMVARKQMPSVSAQTPVARPAPPEEPRIIVVHAPPAQPVAHVPIYAESQREQRQFNVIGGVDELS